MAGPQGVGTVATVLNVSRGAYKHTKRKGSVLLCVGGGLCARVHRIAAAEEVRTCNTQCPRLFFILGQVMR